MEEVRSDIKEALQSVSEALQNYHEFYHDYNGRFARMGGCEYHPLEDIWSTLDELMGILDPEYLLKEHNVNLGPAYAKWYEQWMDVGDRGTYDHDEDITEVCEYLEELTKIPVSTN